MKNFRIFYTPLALLAVALQTHVLLPLIDLAMDVGHRLYRGLTFLFDTLLPATDLALAGGHALTPSRDDQFLKRGLHRRAQPMSARGPEDDDDEDDEIDNGLGGCAHRLNC
jgi:hypothetical protein